MVTKNNIRGNTTVRQILAANGQMQKCKRRSAGHASVSWPCEMMARTASDDCHGFGGRICEYANMYMAMVNANCQLWTNSPEREIKLTPFLYSPNIAGRKSASAILNRVINQEQQATKHKLRDVQIWNIYGRTHVCLNCFRVHGAYANWQRPLVDRTTLSTKGQLVVSSWRPKAIGSNC